jgi:proton-dependent oligopeptide transporter, POT family
MLGHPRGLSTLFFTEMWERFSYYGMRALLILFMVAPITTGGLGFTTRRAATIYGLYTMAVYASSIPGGWFADRVIGHYRSVLCGGILITLGHFSMAIPTLQTFFLGLALIVLGTGMLKPNVSTMVGFLYRPDDAGRDAGFSLFYMGINLGAMTAPLVCGFLGQKVNWHFGFAAAGVGMLLGLTQYILGRKHLPESTPARQRAVDDAADEPLTPSDWKRIGAICVLFVFALIFWSVFEQAGSTLTLFADHHTRLSLFGWTFPSSWFQSEQPLFVIALAPVFAWLWVRLGKREPSSATKFAAGLALTAIGFLIILPAARIAETQHTRVSPLWLTMLYLVHTFGELCLSPVGLSLVTKISPKKVVGLMMGFWFLATSLGNFFAGFIASFADRYPLYRIFTIDFLLAAAGAIALAMLIRPLRSLSVVRASPPATDGRPRPAVVS